MIGLILPKNGNLFMTIRKMEEMGGSATKDLYFQLWYALFVDIFFDGEDVMLITGGTVAPYQRKADDMGKPDYDSPGRYIEFKPE